ncbi:Gmad2 immunoglobulin-like domain-containing protein [Inediibacterium massiliense]|uniref:Gmad2 immunoglobulin-like domain-containing protein n=1 Tax=Inediibacterium massiliense TaxID=1658111 RepID=UPI0006B4B7A7|nr:Gmad2 immunoglobulin-like domain-containing protein [Inediibacterium massiliense]
MRKKIAILLSCVLIIGLSSCGYSQKQNSSATPSQTKEIIPPSTIVSTHKDIFLEIPKEAIHVNRSIEVSGLTALKNLQIHILDENKKILNQEDQIVEVMKNENNWNSFHKQIYFFDSPTSKTGKIKIYSSEKNYVEVPIIFDELLEEGKSIQILYPANEIDQKNFIRVFGYSSVFEGNINYRITKENGEVLTEGFILSTSGAPDIGIFAKDIPLSISSGPVILEVFEVSAKDGEEIGKIIRKLNFINE